MLSERSVEPRSKYLDIILVWAVSKSEGAGVGAEDAVLEDETVSTKAVDFCDIYKCFAFEDACISR